MAAATGIEVESDPRLDPKTTLAPPARICGCVQCAAVSTTCGETSVPLHAITPLPATSATTAGSCESS